MAPNPRKRVMDIRWERPSVLKAPKVTNTDVASTAPEQPLLAAGHTKYQIHPARAHSAATEPGQHLAFRPPPAMESVRNQVSQSSPLNSQGEHGDRPNPPTSTTAQPQLVYKPVVLHRPHPDSKLCENFHWVPYPLGLMPYDSWHNLHHGNDAQSAVPFRCPICRQERKVTAHMRKVFLVAERLLWDAKLMSTHDKDLNEELNWKVNYELGILDPFVEDSDQVPCGKHSRINKSYPYQNELEMWLALRYIFMAENITETMWALWIGTQLDIQETFAEYRDTSSLPCMPKSTSTNDGSRRVPDSISEPHKPPEEVDIIDLTGSPEPPSELAKGKPHGPPTPLSSTPKVVQNVRQGSQRHRANNRQHEVMSFTPVKATAHDTPRPQRIESYKTLQDFYSLLDKIERTSYVGALFLEAYAEKLRDDMCQGCWLKHNINLEHF